MLLAPMLRLFLLFLAAVTGLEFLAVLALLEPYALLHPRLLPAALVRAAFLPMTAVCAFNSFFAHKLARSPLLRIRFPARRANAVCLRPLRRGADPHRVFSACMRLRRCSLLRCFGWPRLRFSRAEPAGSERIPLSADERARVLQLAREAFDLPVDHALPGRSMLVACGGCMLDFLEPDEAARRMLALLPDLRCRRLTRAKTACALAAAQYIRERHGRLRLRRFANFQHRLSSSAFRKIHTSWLGVILDGVQAQNALFLPLCRV